MRGRRSLDPSRLRSLVSGPGVDPRINLTLAEVDQLGFDSANGIYADVHLIPTGENETCLVGGPYAGSSYGFWLPLQQGDLVVVAIPLGDPNHGPVIIARVWDGNTPPPSEAKADQQQDGADVPVQDVILRVQPGQKVRIIASGGADIDLVTDGHVNVGASDGSQVPIALGDKVQDWANAVGGLTGWLASHTHSGGTIAGNTGVANPTPPLPNVPDMEATIGRTK